MKQDLCSVLIWPADGGVIDAGNESEKDPQMGRVVRVRGVGNENELESVSGMRGIELGGEDERQGVVCQLSDQRDIPVNFGHRREKRS